MTTQQTSGTWRRVQGHMEWRIDSDWAEEKPEGWIVTRMVNRTHHVHEWEWYNYTEMTLETVAGDAVDVIVDSGDRVTDTDGERLSVREYGRDGVDAIEAAATAFRVEVPRG